MKTTPKLKPVKAWAVRFPRKDFIAVVAHEDTRQLGLAVFKEWHGATWFQRLICEAGKTEVIPVLITPLPAKRKSPKP